MSLFLRRKGSTALAGGRPSHEWDSDFGGALSGPRKLPIKFIDASYAVVDADSGSVLVVRAAATVTLPAASAARKGMYVDVFVKADVTVVVACTADQMITFNDVDADSLTWSTSSEKVGAACRVLCDGSSWLVFLMTEETQTTSVTT